MEIKLDKGDKVEEHAEDGENGENGDEVSGMESTPDRASKRTATIQRNRTTKSCFAEYV